MNLAKISKWILIVLGLNVAIGGLTGFNPFEALTNGLQTSLVVTEIIVVVLYGVIGLAAAYLAYHILINKKSKK